MCAYYANTGRCFHDVSSIGHTFSHELSSGRIYLICNRLTVCADAYAPLSACHATAIRCRNLVVYVRREVGRLAYFGKALGKH